MFAVTQNMHAFESVVVTDSYAVALLEQFNTNRLRICLILLQCRYVNLLIGQRERCLVVISQTDKYSRTRSNSWNVDITRVLKFLGFESSCQIF